MSEQEREEQDYFPSTELQNAFAMSQMEREPDDSDSINELCSLGRFCVVEEGTVYCNRTDAIMGVHRTLIGDYATEGEAQECLKEYNERNNPNEDVSARIVGPERQTNPEPYRWRDDEIPF